MDTIDVEAASTLFLERGLGWDHLIGDSHKIEYPKPDGKISFEEFCAMIEGTDIVKQLTLAHI